MWVNRARSVNAPAQIQILSIEDDIYANKCRVRYAFNIDVKPETWVEEITRVDGGQPVTETVEKNGFSFFQHIGTLEIDLMAKNLIPGILKSVYQSVVPTLLQRLQAASAEVPMVMNLDE